MSLYRLKISKTVDYCFAMEPEKYRFIKEDEDDSYNYFVGTRLETVKKQKIVMLADCYEVYNNLGNIIQIDQKTNRVVFMVNSDPRFVGALILTEEVEIFLEDLAGAKEDKKFLDSLNFDRNLRNFYRILPYDPEYFSEENQKKEVKIVLYEGITSEIINF
jgi:hypothetical protein